jgi:hypothetical protein
LSETSRDKPRIRADLQPDPVEQQLLEALRVAWGFAAGAPLTVIGQLRERRSAKDRPVFLLQELEHPESGVGLVYPSPREFELASAFVGFHLPTEVSRLAEPDVLLSVTQWAIAELRLSSLEERERRKNPYLCDVRPGTLRLLSEIPKQWNIAVTGPQNALRITALARHAIKVGVQEDQARALKEILAVEERKNETVALFENEIAQTEARRTGSEQALEAVRESIRSEQRRLVALSLIDEADLEALLPEREARDARIGHDFQNDLGGDFALLASFIQARLWKKEMLISNAQLRDFLALIRTHDLVVLAGDSGAGKTSLVRHVAESIGGRFTIIPVKPNWTGPEDLLGYYNPIERSYQATPFLLALQAAAREPDVPHFICLDEMNLARVEHYFADFLSLLENRSDSPVISLYTADEERHTVVEHGLFLAIEAEARARAGLPETATLEDLLKDEQANRMLHQLGGFQDAESVLLHHARLRRALAALIRTPTSLRFPQNVRIVGAINIDETTHYLSPKVLDRVHVLRFRNPVLTDWDALEGEVEKFELDIDLPIRLTARDLGSREDYPSFDRTDRNATFLAGLARQQLDPLGVEFGLRAIRQAMGYIRQAEIVGIEEKAALNNVILHKILPKLMLDTARKGSDGRNRRDILIALRDELSASLAGLEPGACTESCVDALDRLIAAAEGNNGIANYWLR